MAAHLSPRENPEADMPCASEEGSDGGVFFVKLQYRGGTYEVPVETGDAISSIFDFVLEVPDMYDFPKENCKLICKGKVYRPDDVVRSDGEFKLGQGSKLMLMATSAHDAAFVKKSRADPLVKGFKEEERDDKARQKRAKAAAISAWGTKQDPKYRFNSIKAEFKYSAPSPYEAEKLLQKLSTDPGIIEIMKTRHFEVGILTEMSPADAQDRMKKMGKDPNMDLLGYNQNAGEMIVLRLRTDNTKGFRPYHDLINTLIHEMTHNVQGPHDAAFWKLFGELKAQYMKFHRFWSHGGQATSDTGGNGQFQGFAGGDDDDEKAGDFGHTLGGASSASEAPLTDAQVRERRLLAVEARKVTGTIDFVNSGGKVMIVCPCGQLHDAGDCPSGFIPSEADTKDDSGKPADMEIEPAASSSAADCNAGAASAEAEDNSRQVTDMEVEPPSSSSAAEPNPAAASQVVDVEMEAVVPNGHAEMSRVEEQSSSGAATQPHQEFDTCPLAGLSPEDLEALGLGGATEWLQSFSEKLQALRSHTAQSTVKQALELLLLLVRNVVKSPGEAKFRRIKADNPKIRTSLLAAGPEVEKLITLFGFEVVTEDGGRVFVLRDAAFDTARLQMGTDLLQQQISTLFVTAH